MLAHLRELEDFLTAIYNFFEDIPLVGSACGADGGSALRSQSCHAVSSPEGATAGDDVEQGPSMVKSNQREIQIDRGVAGYLVSIECGHNGILSGGELQHLSLHLRAARFGKYSEGPCKDGASEGSEKARSSSQEETSPSLSPSKASQRGLIAV